LAHPDDVNTAEDLTLVQVARAGDRLAFGVLYLRHHAAAWRVACVASRFSPDAELAVIEGFTRVFSALPAESEEFETGGVTLRPYLLACVRQAALDRASAAGRGDVADEPPTPLAGLGPDGEVVLSALEHHVARGALAALPERSRIALWLTDVEAMTPGEVAGILGGQPQELADLAAEARATMHTAQQAALGRQEVRAGCRFTVDHLDAYRAGTLDPTDGLIVRAHLTGCPPCRMRQGELSIAPAVLAGAVPAAPLLGGEAQHHWLTSVGDIRPADRLLPPVLAAGGSVPREPLGRRTVTLLGTAAGAAMIPARGLPDALRRAGRAAAGGWHSDADSIDLTTRSGPPPDPTRPPGWTGSPGWSGSPTPSLPPDWTIPPGRAARNRADRRGEGHGRRRPARRTAAAVVPALARRAGRGARSTVPAMALAVAWVLVMMALPRLMTPSTAPGPGGLALPAVQAYVPGFLPDRARQAGSGSAAAAKSRAGETVAGSGAGQSAAAENNESDRGAAESAGLDLQNGPAIGLIAAAATRPSGVNAARPRPDGPPAAAPSESVPAAAPVAAAAAPVAAAAAPVAVAAATTAIRPRTLIPAVIRTPTAPNVAAPQRKKPKVEKRDKPAPARPEKGRRTITA
jgi:DNA-directed RNA polymerase specialized sigma24 family protein